ncbi:hypothetical protein IEQ34_012893 [Dendrobium chrysotoxum]|uniref:Uncharacterized protein n=1 Tax=Dendrobium chrysotoxum TaxID=161865 RepID=A0AAV7GPX5_DENCH|nr:hypothetical protein IEQ34_012893 [Dendrobium chrysotoxum]
MKWLAASSVAVIPPALPPLGLKLDGQETFSKEEDGREVTKRSHHPRRARVRPALVELGEAKVAEAAIELSIKEDVASLNVAVEDDALPFLVEIKQGSRHAANDAEANRPRE